LQEFTGHGATVTTQNDSQVTIVIPKNTNGEGYVCYGRPTQLQAFLPQVRVTTQEYEGARDLDIKAAVENERVQVCRVFCEAHTDLRVGFSFDGGQWTPDTSIQLEIDTPQGSKLLSKSFRQADSHGSFTDVKAASKGFYTIFVKSTNTPAGNKSPAYKLTVSYTAPQVL
jgi:alpha-amylase